MRERGRRKGDFLLKYRSVNEVNVGERGDIMLRCSSKRNVG